MISVLTELGLVNEVQRPDRDAYINVNWYAINDDFKQFFQKHSEWSPTNEGYPFDLSSVMMFDSYDFTKDWFKIFEKLSTVSYASNATRSNFLTR